MLEGAFRQVSPSRMFKLFLISIVIVPVLIGIFAADERARDGGRSLLRVVWVVYATLWLALLYYLRSRWA